MSSALKPALPQGAGGQTGAAQNNSTINNMGSGQGMIHNSQGHGHLGHHPHMGQNMAQNMAHMPHMQNMGHMPHMGQNINMTHLPGGFNASQGAKGINHSSPLSLVQEKSPSQVNASQPLALTRSPEKENDEVSTPPDQPNQSNGTSESPKVDTSCPADTAIETATQPQQTTPVKSAPPEVKEVAEPETESDSSDLPKQSPPSPPAVGTEVPSPQKPAPAETSAPPAIEQSIKNNEPKETIEPSEKTDDEKEKLTSPFKNLDSKNEPEILPQPKPDTAVEEPPKNEKSTSEEESKLPNDTPAAPEIPKQTPAEEKPIENVEAKEDDKPTVETAKSPAKLAETTAEVSPAKETTAKPQSPITPAQKKTEIKPKSTLKLATVTPILSRKRKKDLKMPLQAGDGPSPPKRVPTTPKDKSALDTSKADTPSAMTDAAYSPDSRSSKRNRTKVQPYQIPTPELAMLTKLTASQGRTTPTKQSDEKLIVFYKNEFLAVRNTEGGFYVCQTMQNVYRSTRKIKIRWLSQDKTADPSGEIYKPDFYDVTDIDCVLTTLSLQRAGTAGLKLGAAELARTQSILGRALAAERGEPAPDSSVTEEHPDGLDLSLYKDESQLEKKKQKGSSTPSRKRTHSKSLTPETPAKPHDPDGEDPSPPSPPKSSPRKRSSRPTPKKPKVKTPKAKTPKTGKKGKTPAKEKDKSAATTPQPTIAPSTSKTATASAKSPAVTPAKRRAPVKVLTPTPSTSKGKTTKSTPAKVAAAAKAVQLASTPSTSTGKVTRTPRKPPSKK